MNNRMNRVFIAYMRINNGIAVADVHWYSVPIGC